MCIRNSLIVAAMFAALSAQAQILLTGTNPTYSENFNSLPASGTPTWTNNSTLPGWYSVFQNPGPFKFLVGDGSSNAGGLYSFGTGTSTDRALGSTSSGTPNTVYFGVVLKNDTGKKITNFRFFFQGEQWRNGGNTAAQTLSFGWKTATTLADASDLKTTFTAEASGDFTSPIASTTASALDGNADHNRKPIGPSNVPLTLNPGEFLTLRWSDPNDPGNDHGMGIDDFDFRATTEAVPEPFTLALGAGGLALAIARRRRTRRS